MQTSSDVQLLGRYARQGSEAAFGEIVARYADLVYSAALRQVESPDLAGDVAQSVFVDLSRKASSLLNRLQPEASLAGWLYRSTWFAASAVRRDRRRRESRESQAMHELHSDNSATEGALNWEILRPLLDEALSSLGEADRDALLLRFFEKFDFKAVGVALGISDDAAQKRVSRALDKLRTILARRGVTTTAAALSLAISTHAVKSAPIGLATAMTSAALASKVVAPAIMSASKALFMTTLQKALTGVLLATAIGTGIHEARRAAQLSSRLRSLEQHQSALMNQLAQLTQERDRAGERVAAARQENQRLRELAQARVQAAPGSTGDSTELALNAWLKRINLLKQRLGQIPQEEIPELRLLKNLDWVEVAASTKLESETDYRMALAELRKRAGGYFVDQLHNALGKFLLASNGQWPQTMAQMEGYFDPPVDTALLDRWEIVPTTAFPGREFASQQVITEKSVVDPEFDSRHTIDSPGSGAVGPYHPLGYQEQNSGETKEGMELKAAVQPAVDAYKLANGGAEPSGPSDLRPYATSPEQNAALDRIMALMNQPTAERYGTNFRDSTVKPSLGGDK